MSQAATLTPTKASAAGQYLGFSLQQLRLCHHLLRTKGDYEVSFELLDDVAVHAPDGHVLLEQCKSTTASNPIADRATDLWKAFAHWADLVKDGKIDPAKSEFLLYVASTGSANLALDLSGAKTGGAIAAALRKVKALHKIGSQAAAVDGHIAKFLAAGDTITSAIIRNFTLTIDPDPDESVKAFLRTFLEAEALNNFSAAAIGMARDIVDGLIRKGEKPIVSAPKFQASLRAFVRKNNLANLLVSTTPKPDKERINSYLNAAPVFVRQLQSVKVSSDILTTAISDWLRATADKINWASEGAVFDGSFSEFDDRLVRRHKIVRDSVEDQLAEKTPEYRGREIYRRCADTELPLEGSAVPDHFVAGAFNCLADISKLGWHPDYAALFPPDGDEYVMTIETPITLVQNPAFGAMLMWKFCSGFQKERPDALPVLTSLFCVLPVILHGPTLRELKSTNMPSGLVKFATKLGEQREAVVALHDRALAMRELTFASVATGIATRLLRLDYATAEVGANEERLPLLPERLKSHYAGAEKLGHWFARIPLSLVFSTLQIEP